MTYFANQLPRSWDSFDIYLFDIDGTLLTCSDAVHYFAFCDALQFVSGKSLTLDGVITHGNTDIGILRDALALAGIHTDCWRPQIHQLTERMCSFVDAHAHEICAAAMPSVFDVLEHLHAQGATLGVATGNLQKIGQLKLQKAGLLHFFEFAGWSDLFEYRADVFRHAVTEAQRLKCQSSSICVIGDTPADIRAARANQLNVIAVATGIYSFQELCAEKPDLCLHSLRELLTPQPLLA